MKKKKKSEIRQSISLKYEKYFKRFLLNGLSVRGFEVNSFLINGNVGFYSKKVCYLSINEINSIITTIKHLVSKRTSRKSTFFKRIIPTIPFTRKPLQTRMGGGKGIPEGFFCLLKQGAIFLEIFTDNIIELKKIFRIIKRKVSFPIGIILE